MDILKILHFCNLLLCVCIHMCVHEHVHVCLRGMPQCTCGGQRTICYSVLSFHFYPGIELRSECLYPRSHLTALRHSTLMDDAANSATLGLQTDVL